MSDPKPRQSTLKEGFPAAATSNSEIIWLQIRAGTGANLQPWQPQKDMGKEGDDQFHSPVLSSKDKSGNEGRKPRMHQEQGRMGVIAAFPGPGCTLCFGTLFLKKANVLSTKILSTLVTTAYETTICKDARLHANALEILWRISQK